MKLLIRQEGRLPGGGVPNFIAGEPELPPLQDNWMTPSVVGSAWPEGHTGPLISAKSVVQYPQSISL